MGAFRIVSQLNPVVVNMSGGFVGSITGNTAGVPAVVSSGTMYLAGGNNVTLSQDGNTISINGGAGGGGGSINLSAGTTSNNLTNFVLSNSNGLAFGLSGSTVTGSYTVPTQSVQTQNLHNVSLSGNTAGVMAQISSGTMTLAGGNNITLSQNGNAVTISGPNTVAQTQFVLSNSNGVSFGTNGSTVTATVRTDYQSAGAYLTTARASNDAIGLNTAQSNVTWTVNSSGLSLDARGYAGTGTTGTNATFTLNSNGLQLNAGAYLTTAMASNRGSDFVQANAAFAGTNASGTIASNGISVSVNPAAAGVGIVAGTRTATTAGELLFDNANGVTFGLNSPGGSIMTASHNGLTSQSNQALSGSNGSFTFQTATFGNANGMSFLTSNGSMVGSYTVPTVTNSSMTVSDANTSGTLARLAFTNLNGVTLSLSTGGGGSHTVVGSHNALTSQSNQNVTAGNGGFAFQTLSFSNANGMSFGTSAGSAITGSYTVPTQTNQTVGGYFVGNTTGQSSSSTADARSISIDGAGIVSAGWSNGSIRISATQSNQAFSAQGGSSTFQTLSFTNSNGISFSNTNGSIWGSHNGITSQTNQTVGLYASSQTTGQSSSSTYDARSLSFRGAGIVSVGNSGGEFIISATGGGGGVNPAASASNGSFAFTTLNFSDANNVTFGTSAGGIITASVAPPGAAAENNWHHALGANTAGNTTASGSTIGLSGINLTISGTNNSVMNLSVPATSSLSATGAVSISTNGSTISIGAPNAQTLYDWDNMGVIGSMNLISNITATAFSGGRPLFVPVQLDGYMSFNRLQIEMSRSTSGSNSFTVNFGLYSFSNSTRIDLIGSFQNAFAGTATASISGIRRFELSHTNTAISFLSPGHYIAGIGFSANGGNTASMNYSLRGGLTANPPVGLIGQGTDANTTATSALSTLHLREFRGLWSTTTAAMPSSVAKTQVSAWTTGGHPYLWMGSR